MADLVYCLLATAKGQGIHQRRDNDFFFALEGEPVTYHFECTGEKADDSCGCARSWSGVVSHKGTTTAMVSPTPMPRYALVAFLTAGLLSGGWAEVLDDEALADRAELEADLIQAAVAGHAPGTVLERRDEGIKERVVG